MDYVTLERDTLIELLEERDSKISELEQKIEEKSEKVDNITTIKEEIEEYLETLVNDGKAFLKTINY